MNNVEDIRTNNIEICFQECKGILRSLAYKYKNIYNGDTEEAFAEACMWLVEMYDNFDRDRATFVTYAYSVIENKFINASKKHKKEKQFMSNVTIDELDDGGLLVAGENSYGQTDSEVISKGQMERYNLYFELFKYIDVLKDREQTIFKLFYYDNWSIKEIADEMELSEIWVKEIKSKSIRKLKNELKKAEKAEKS